VTDQPVWYIDSLQLWKNTDNYPGSLDINADSLIDAISVSKLAVAAPGSPTSDTTFSLGSDLILDAGKTTFFVTMIVREWRTENDLEDMEITDQHGAQLGITVDKAAGDIEVVHTDGTGAGTSNAWAGDVTKLFTVQAINLPVIIRNGIVSEDSNMFYPNYLAIDGSDESKAQTMRTLTIEAHVFLPHDGSVNGDSLSYASFKIGWKSHYLDTLGSIVFGDVWDGKQYQGEGWDTGSYGIIEDDTVQTRRFEAIVMGNFTSPQNYVGIANNSLGVFYFKVKEPGICPLFLSNIRILDQWGIPYHCYQKLQNENDADTADAWSKQILGDFADSKGTLIDGNCDGLIEPFDDVTLFADFFWLDSLSDNWYARFDVGSDSTTYNPDNLRPDGKTDFFDLMVIGTNYYRTLRGDFSQKAVVYKDLPELAFNVTGNTNKPNIYRAKLDMKNIPEIVSAHLKLTFDPANYMLSDLKLGDWVTESSSQNILLYPPEELEKGIVDVNFLALEKPISGEGCFLTAEFEKIGAETGLIQLDHADLRDRNCQQVALDIDVQPEPVVISDYFLMECYPNPFNPVTNLSYLIPEGSNGFYRISVCDLQGKLVRELAHNYHSGGQYHLNWNGLNHLNVPVSSGIYFIRVEGANILKNYKITLMR
ncbi:MAG: T9SS type A sorting domain-containing protein, partial [Candidatus Marinimicrobia bacterium]|nr:T9SS type A sorting domain-containing protein [Candidatus Neomarinimicrobiota bacterium]